MTPLEQALTAWRRAAVVVDEVQHRQCQFDDAVTLGETGVFSNRNIAHILGMNQRIVASLTGKTDNSGGRLNPASLPLLLDASIMWARSHDCDVQNIRRAVDLGTSWRMIATLTGIPRTTAYSKARQT